MPAAKIYFFNFCDAREGRVHMPCAHHFSKNLSLLWWSSRNIIQQHDRIGLHMLNCDCLAKNGMLVNYMVAPFGVHIFVAVCTKCMVGLYA